MTSQWVERTWIRTGGYGRFRGEWVKTRKKKDGCQKGSNREEPNSHARLTPPKKYNIKYTHIRVSSANISLEQDRVFGISLVYSTKSRGPKMEPLDTPDMTGPQSEKASSMTTLYIRLRLVNR